MLAHWHYWWSEALYPPETETDFPAGSDSDFAIGCHQAEVAQAPRVSPIDDISAGDIDTG